MGLVLKARKEDAEKKSLNSENADVDLEKVKCR